MLKTTQLLIVALCYVVVLPHLVAPHKLVTYWGQNGCYAKHRERENWEKPLVEFCTHYKYDTIVLSFMHVFFDNANKDNMPGLNFAFHCEKGLNEQYPALLRCPNIERGIIECQRRGVSVLMSLGGASGAYSFTGDAQARLFAYRVYHLLLEGRELQKLRPFGNAILNGVDLDIEGGPPTGYSTFVKELRRLESAGSAKITISAAPQCPYPDAIQGPSPGHFLGDVPELIDEIYVQFYNNWCYMGNAGLFMGSLKKWLEYSGKTNGPKVFIGVPAADGAGGGYATPDVVQRMYDQVKHEARLGGIMMWDAGFDQNNIINGRHFSEHVADFLERGPRPTVRPITLPHSSTKPPTHGPKTTRVGPKTTKTKDPTRPHPTKRYYKNCDNLPDGLYPLRDCRKYIQCAQGKTYRFTCPAGLFFNPKSSICDWPDHVDCKMPTAAAL